MSKADLRDAASQKWTQALAVKRVASWLRHKQANRVKLLPMQRTLSNLQPPNDLSAWNGRRMYLCDRCGDPCPCVSVTCYYCNIVMHKSCLTSEELEKYNAAKKASTEQAGKGILEKKPTTPQKKDGSGAGADDNNLGGYVCEFCSADRELDLSWHAAERDRLWREENMQANAMLIGRILRGFLSRFRYKRYQRSVVKFQSLLRRFLTVRQFKAYRRNMKRPMLLNILAARDMPIANRDHSSCDPYVIMTVHDGYHREQVCRYDTTTQYGMLDCEWQPQNFLIPGVSGNAMLVFTVVDEEEVRDQFLGQVALPLSRNDVWKTGGVFDIDLGDLQYIIRDNKAQQSDMAYEKITPSGQITVQLKPLSYLNSVCGSIEGPHIDVLMTLTKLGVQSLSLTKAAQRTAYWGVVADGKLMIYRHFGDKDPKVTVDLAGMAIKRGDKSGRIEKIAKNAAESMIHTTVGPGGRSMALDGNNGINHNAFGIDGAAATADEEERKQQQQKASNRKAKRGSAFANTGENSKANSHLREFFLKSSDLASSNRNKYGFECPTVKEARHWYEVIEYWINAGKKARGRSRSQRQTSFRQTMASSARSVNEEAAQEVAGML
jgi:hypothetical protein